MTNPATPEPETAPDPVAAPPTAPRNRRLVTAFAVLAVAVLVADQLSKEWALANLTVGEWRPLLGEWIQLTLVFNPGAALSFGTGMTWVLTIVAVVVTAVVVRSARKLGSRGWALALGLLLGGALGNLVDRFFREPGVARGHVVDFIDYFGWFVGNVADIAIVGAAGLIMILSVRGIRLDGTREQDHAAEAARASEDDPAASAPEPDTTP
ncbi:MAG: signal peptidase II [Actinomycetales bacterium]|nr:signal peptidase II [Actinomycetales bacterium]